MDNKNILTSLRQMKFPDNARAALNHCTAIYCVAGSTGSPGNCDEVDEQILSEFIFLTHLKEVSAGSVRLHRVKRCPPHLGLDRFGPPIGWTEVGIAVRYVTKQCADCARYV